MLYVRPRFAVFCCAVCFVPCVFFLVVGNFLFSFCYTYHDEIVGIFGIQRIHFRRVI